MTVTKQPWPNSTAFFNRIIEEKKDGWILAYTSEKAGEWWGAENPPPPMRLVVLCQELEVQEDMNAGNILQGEELKDNKDFAYELRLWSIELARAISLDLMHRPE